MRYFSRDGLTFDVVDAGPRDGQAVVLLHGWPQDSSAWEGVTPALNTAGLRTLAPDLRGYSPGARPPRHFDYTLAESVRDVEALLDEAGIDRAHVVGHDWGGALAWAFAGARPDRVETLSVLSTPPGWAMAHGARHGDQAKRSAYMALFALPALMAFALRRWPRPILRRLGMPAPSVERYAKRLAEPGAAQGGLNWYRAALSPTLTFKAWRAARSRRAPSSSSGSATVADQTAADTTATGGRTKRRIPTAYAWGTKDPAFSPVSVQRTVEVLRAKAEQPEDFLTLEVRSGHWLPERHADEVADLVLRRVGRPRHGGAASDSEPLAG